MKTKYKLLQFGANDFRIFINFRSREKKKLVFRSEDKEVAIKKLNELTRED